MLSTHSGNSSAVEVGLRHCGRDGEFRQRAYSRVTVTAPDSAYHSYDFCTCLARQSSCDDRLNRQPIVLKNSEDRPRGTVLPKTAETACSNISALAEEAGDEFSRKTLQKAVCGVFQHNPRNADIRRSKGLARTSHARCRVKKTCPTGLSLCHLVRMSFGNLMTAPCGKRGLVLPSMSSSTTRRASASHAHSAPREKRSALSTSSTSPRGESYRVTLGRRARGDKVEEVEGPPAHSLGASGGGSSPVFTQSR